MGSPDVRVIGGIVAYCLVVKLEEVDHEGFSLHPQFLFCFLFFLAHTQYRAAYMMCAALKFRP